MLNAKLKKETVTAEDIEKIVDILNQLSVGWSVDKEKISVKMFEYVTVSLTPKITQFSGLVLLPTFTTLPFPPSHHHPHLFHPLLSSISTHQLWAYLTWKLTHKSTIFSSVRPLHRWVLLIRPDAVAWEYITSSRAHFSRVPFSMTQTLVFLEN